MRNRLSFTLSLPLAKGSVLRKEKGWLRTKVRIAFSTFGALYIEAFSPVATSQVPIYSGSTTTLLLLSHSCCRAVSRYPSILARNDSREA